MSSPILSSSFSSFVDESMARRLELNEMLAPLDYVKVQQQLRPELNFAWERIAGGLAFYAGESPLSQTVGMGLHGPVSGEQFDQFEDFYRSRNVTAQIVLSPYADPTLLGHVRERGYRLAEFNSVMVRQLRPSEGFADVDGVQIERVTPETAHRWAEVLVAGFAEFGEFPTELFEPYGLLPNGINFLAYVGGEIAGGAAGTVYPEHKLAAIFGASTLPRFRRRGVQNALFTSRLEAAAQAGCELAVVCTLPGSGSQRNAERNGFRVAYTKAVLVRSWE